MEYNDQILSYVAWLADRGQSYPSIIPFNKSPNIDEFQPKTTANAPLSLVILSDTNGQSTTMTPSEIDLLTKMMAAIGLRPKDYLIASPVVFASAPDPSFSDADPNATRIKIIEILRNQNPLMILALGHVMTSILLGHQVSPESFQRVRGQILLPKALGTEFSKNPFIATYHPRDLLAFPAHKRPTWEDLKSLQKSLKSMSQNDSLNIF